MTFSQVLAQVLLLFRMHLLWCMLITKWVIVLEALWHLNATLHHVSNTMSVPSPVMHESWPWFRMTAIDWRFPHWESFKRHCQPLLWERRSPPYEIRMSLKDSTSLSSYQMPVLLFQAGQQSPPVLGLQAVNHFIHPRWCCMVILDTLLPFLIFYNDLSTAEIIAEILLQSKSH